MATNNKSSKPTTATSFVFSPWKLHNIYTLPLILFLCISSYSLGVWQHGGTSADTVTATAPVLAAPCKYDVSLSKAVVELDFLAHHSLNYTDDDEEESQTGARKVYPPCDAKYSEYTPCQDAKRSLKFSRDRLVYRERHCPERSDLLMCRVPAPHGYRNPFPWPRSRDLVWYANVPHKELTVEKANQNWIRYEGDRFRFPGGGTMFPDGADAYIDDIGKLINLRDGSVRTAIDTGCGVASWGAYLLSRNILTMSFAPRDTHEAQVQFALERGVPALIGILASKRLPYPSRAFDMAHCSRCLIPCGQFDGIYLIEVDRVLRPGGYWILSGPPINWRKHWKGWGRTKQDLTDEQSIIEEVAKSLCWKKVVEKGDIAIWQKPINHISCKVQHSGGRNPPFCSADQNPDRAWYTKMEICLTPLPEISNIGENAGGELPKWPERLNSVPPRISKGTVEDVTAQIFQQDSELWKKRLSHYKLVNNMLGRAGRYRNLLDMNAYLGGFAAALSDLPVWVMNVVPVDVMVDTLGVIYERGLIGTYQNWCEAMSTYPRTYDLIHVESVFSLYKDRCEMEVILLEMDRILRPEGSVIFRDDVDVLVKIKRITDGMEWESKIVDHEDGPMEREKLLFAVKKYWTAPAAASDSDQQITKTS